jgi:nickel/cobalt exporter
MRPGEVLTMGISAGLVPCPGAMAVFLIGVSSGQYLLGLATVTAFSIGLAAALVAIGIVVVLSTTAAARATSGWRWTRLLPLATAIIVTVLGVVMLWRAVVSPHSHEDHSHLMRSPLVANIST